MNKRSALDKIAHEIETCTFCKLGKSGKAVPGEGSPNAKIMFIGEAPGKNEAKTGRPFVGRSGQLLRRAIVQLGLKEEDVYITSPVKYLPDRGTPTEGDIAHGREHLMKQIAIIQPIIIVLLGRVAIQGVLNEKKAITKEHGQVVESKGIRYFLSYHPAAAIRFSFIKSKFLDDFTILKTFLQKLRIVK